MAALLRAHEGPVVVLSHENPDGDALGSVLGLTRALRSLGKTVVAPMDVPRYLRFLPGPGETSGPLTQWPDGALAVVVDVDNNDAIRVAGADLRQFGGEVINLDHHGTNQRRATAGVVDPALPAAVMIVADVLNELGITWTENIATPLMLGLITDTGSFRFNSVTPQTFVCAARLLEHGARLGWINDSDGPEPASVLPVAARGPGHHGIPARRAGGDGARGRGHADTGRGQLGGRGKLRRACCATPRVQNSP